MNILVIGLGNMGFAIVNALLSQNNSSQLTLHVCEPSNKFEDQTKKLAIKVFSTLQDITLQNYNIILLAVKPNIVPEVLQELSPSLSKSTNPPLILSIAAGISTSYIAQTLGSETKPYPHVIRYMPTLAAQKQESITALSLGKNASTEDMQNAFAIAQSFGKVIQISESFMDAFTGIAGSGIAFATAFIEALTHAGISEGIAPQQAYICALQATKGAISLLEFDTLNAQIPAFESPAKLISAISSPGGTTVAGMTALKKPLQEQTFYDSVKNAVHAASEKSKSMNLEK